MYVGPWKDTPRPSDAAYVVGAWEMARIGSAQHPSNVRALWAARDGGWDAPELLGVGGAVQIAPGDGLAFVWMRDGVSPMAWRRVLPALRVGLWGCHERGMRRIVAVVEAAHAQGIRLLRALGFAFAGLATGFAGTSAPMLSYARAWPAFAEPLPVRHQRQELERACFASWCPALVA